MATTSSEENRESQRKPERVGKLRKRDQVIRVPHLIAGIGVRWFEVLPAGAVHFHRILRDDATEV